MFKPKESGGKEEYRFLEQFVTNSKLKVMSCSQLDPQAPQLACIYYQYIS